MRVVLETILTDEVYAAAMPLAEKLEAGLKTLIAHHGLAWQVVRVGLRAEIVTAPTLPSNGTEALIYAHSEVEHALHLYCLNRGVVITPFHNMMLVCPETRAERCRYTSFRLDAGMAELSGRAAARSRIRNATTGRRMQKPAPNPMPPSPLPSRKPSLSRSHPDIEKFAMLYTDLPGVQRGKLLTRGELSRPMKTAAVCRAR